ncbi:MAG: phosphoenolpyruvate--protein phosphotransferase [Herpetosiphon sp.]
MKLHGQGVSSGVAVGPVRVWRSSTLVVPYRTLLTEQLEAELTRLDHALSTSRQELGSLANALRKGASSDVASIFEAHIEMLDDPEIIDECSEQIRSQLINAEHALADVMGRYAATLRNVGDEYLSQRATDLEDVLRRVLRHLLGGTEELHLDQPVILVADDLAPSDTAQFPPGMLLGFATAGGGATSHTAILARALGIPAIVGVGKGILQLVDDTVVTLDGAKGLLDGAPSADDITAFQRLHTEQQQHQAEERRAAQAPAMTGDGQRVEVLANIALPKNCKEALGWGAEGVGLFRTEFLFLDRTEPPSEAEQYTAYCEVIEAVAGRRCLIRTADIGGDKDVPYLGMEQEANPFLGWRGSRLIWGMELLLRTQLRALLRASVHGPVGIMFPMIAGVSDFRVARKLLDSVWAELIAEHAPVGDVAVGVMIEIPSAALNAAHLARECDFFSIGTNDLTQYTLACDRTNQHVAHLLDAFHPAVLALIAKTIEAGRQAGIHVGMCGEMAADLDATPILLGFGLSEFSASPAAIPALKHRIGRLTSAGTQEVAKAVLNLATPEEVRAYVANRLEDTQPEHVVHDNKAH